jgi:hypothetical protein
MTKGLTCTNGIICVSAQQQRFVECLQFTILAHTKRNCNIRRICSSCFICTSTFCHRPALHKSCCILVEHSQVYVQQPHETLAAKSHVHCRSLSLDSGCESGHYRLLRMLLHFNIPIPTCAVRILLCWALFIALASQHA